MRRASGIGYPDRRPLRWAVAMLGGGVLATALLVATVTTGQAGGLFDWLFTGKDPKRSEAPPSPASAPLATAHLTVEGMVCYG